MKTNYEKKKAEGPRETEWEENKMQAKFSVDKC